MEEESSLISKILWAHTENFGDILENASQYRFQVLLSQVERHPSGERRLVRHGYRVDAEFFYPASAIKLAAVVAAAEKLEQYCLQGDQEFQLASPTCFYPLFEDGEEQKHDPSNLNENKITLAHEIRKLFLVSDNEAFNRLYAVVGHRSLNQIMWDKGFKSARFHHRLDVYLSPSVNHCCEPVEVHMDGIPYVLAPKRSELLVPDNRSLPGILVGQAHVAENGELVREPMDFSLKNYISLMDLQNLLVQLVRPDVQLSTLKLLKPGTDAFQIGGGVRMMLLEAMSQYPASSSNPHYDGAEYPDDYGKFFLPGVARVRRKGAIRIYNKIGRAYGFTIDNAYILDIETGQSFFLTAVIYSNKNEIVNDDVYEYEDIADRAMADLREVVADALWTVPEKATNNSTPFDRTPSSLWSMLDQPIVSGRTPFESPVQSSLQTLLAPEDQEQVRTCKSGQISLEGEELEMKVKTEERVVSPVASERNIRGCYGYFLDE